MSDPTRLTMPRSLLAGLGAGAVAALIAAAVSLPLHSPDDAFFNSATVSIGTLIAGLFAGAVWRPAQGHARPLVVFGPIMAGAFLVVATGALIAEALPDAPLDRIASFTIPLAAIVFATLAILTPVLARPVMRAELAAPAVTVIALAFGLGLAGEGDAESGRLALPDLPAASPGVAASSWTPAGDGLVRPGDVTGVTFTVAPGESKATYTVREKLAQLPLPNDAVGSTTAVTGAVRLDGGPSQITVDLRTLQSDQPMRDRTIRERAGLMSDTYPFAEFTVTSLANLPSEYRPGETVTSTVTGTMKLREVERPTSFAVEARMQDNLLYIVGRTDFTWADFQIPPPNVAGLVQVEDNIHIEILIVAKRDGQG